MGPQARHWRFILNNHTDHDINKLLNPPPPEVQYLVFRKGKSSIKGYLITRSRKRLGQVLSIIGECSYCTLALLWSVSEFCDGGRVIEIGTRSNPFREITSSFWDILASGIVALVSAESES